ncbi:MAG: DUF4190 domain-containing protein [Bacillota bacterium]
MRERTNGKAVSSFSLGALSIVTPYIGTFLGVLGILGSFIALREIKHSRVHRGVYQKGANIAVIAIILCLIGFL